MDMKKTLLAAAAAMALSGNAFAGGTTAPTIIDDAALSNIVAGSVGESGAITKIAEKIPEKITERPGAVYFLSDAYKAVASSSPAGSAATEIIEAVYFAIGGS